MSARGPAVEPMNIVVLGLSVTSSWGNGHATTYRALLRALHGRGHRILFFERDVPWYAAHRDLPAPPFCRTALYDSVETLRRTAGEAVRDADLVIVGSYVPEGIEVGEWVTQTARGPVAFYDIDTPVTVAALLRGECSYLSAELLHAFDLYLSFTGGPLLRRIEAELGARRAVPLYCSVDPEQHRPMDSELRWDLGYMGTYSSDRQPSLERMLVQPARSAPERRFVVAGPQYPAGIEWPANVERVEHLPPERHGTFYNEQRFTLNVTRADMIAAGHSPSVRLFEAAACGVPVISDAWSGLDDFFTPGEEILVSGDGANVSLIVAGMPEAERREIGRRARQRVLGAHTAEHRAVELERYAAALLAKPSAV
jgi:spore maturation protein CgeB